MPSAVDSGILPIMGNRINEDIDTQLPIIGQFQNPHGIDPGINIWLTPRIHKML